VHNSNFINNVSFDLKASACSDPSTVIDAENNFWVATDSATIADEHIYDNSDDVDSPIVDFMPFLMEEIRGTISGTVSDHLSNPIPDVYVSVAGIGIDDYTDSNGEYILEGLDTDYYDVFFTHGDYSDTTIAGVFARIGSTKILDVFMQSPFCSYLIGDCNHNGSPIELADVIAMISMYRGSVDPYYICDCGVDPPGAEFAATADPNGNCVPFELGDVITEIGAYRGSAEASSCEDCPGSLRLFNGRGDQPPPMPSLKSKN
jgi:hypothetical protein